MQMIRYAAAACATHPPPRTQRAPLGIPLLQLFISTATDPLGRHSAGVQASAQREASRSGRSVGVEAARSRRESRFVTLTAGSQSGEIPAASRENEIWRGRAARGLFA